jgi:hypothetical protein
MAVEQVKKEEPSDPMTINSPTSQAHKPEFKLKGIPTSPTSSIAREGIRRRSVLSNNSKDHLTTEEIEKSQMSQLRIINIKNNLTTLESYKSIWTLLDINPDVVIYFDSE